MDLKIEAARLPDRSGIWDVAIANGTIIEIAPKITSPADNILAAKGKLVIPGLVDPHFHLDKALLLERSPAHEGNFSEAMRETLRLKQSFTVTDIQARARRIIEQAISCFDIAQAATFSDPARG